MALITDSIGVTGRDFLGPALWNASLGAHAGDDVTGELFDDATYDELSVFNDGTPTSAKLTVPLAERGDTAGTGSRYVRTGSGSPIEVTVDLFDVEHVEVDLAGNSAPNGGIFINRSGADRNQVMNLKNVMVHDNSVSAVGRLVYFNNDCGNVLNGVFYDLTTTGAANMINGVRMIRNVNLSVLAGNAIDNVQNNGSTGEARGLVWADDANNTAQNNSVTRTGGSSSGVKRDYELTAPANSTTDHNLSSDTSSSGTGSLISKSAVNQYVSITDGMQDYHSKAGADVIDAGIDLGTTPSGIEFTKGGFNRDTDTSRDPWDMGPFEFLAAAPPAGFTRILRSPLEAQSRDALRTAIS